MKYKKIKKYEKYQIEAIDLFWAVLWLCVAGVSGIRYSYIFAFGCFCFYLIFIKNTLYKKVSYKKKK